MHVIPGFHPQVVTWGFGDMRILLEVPLSPSLSLSLCPLSLSLNVGSNIVLYSLDSGTLDFTDDDFTHDDFTYDDFTDDDLTHDYFTYDDIADDDFTDDDFTDDDFTDGDFTDDDFTDDDFTDRAIKQKELEKSASPIGRERRKAKKTQSRKQSGCCWLVAPVNYCVYRIIASFLYYFTL